MKKGLVTVTAVAAIVGLAIVGVASEYEIHINFLSGVFTTGYSNANYTDTVSFQAANASFNAVYNANDITRDFNMYDSFYWEGSSMYGPPNPGPVDWINCFTQETGTGFYVEHKLSYQKPRATSGPPLGPSNITGKTYIDFATGDVQIGTKCWVAGGHWQMVEEVGKDTDGDLSTIGLGEYQTQIVSSAGSKFGSPPPANSIHGLYTKAKRDEWTWFLGTLPNFPAYQEFGPSTVPERGTWYAGPTPPNLDLSLLNPSGMDIDGHHGGTYTPLNTSGDYVGGTPLVGDPVFAFVGSLSGSLGDYFDLFIKY